MKKSPKLNLKQSELVILDDLLVDFLMEAGDNLSEAKREALDKLIDQIEANIEH